MTHFPDELIEAARAAYEHANSTWRKNGSTWGPWEKLTEEGKQMVCADFAAGLRTIPVSDGVLKPAADLLYTPPISPPEFLAIHGERLEKRHRDAANKQAQTAVTATITYLTGGGK